MNSIIYQFGSCSFCVSGEIAFFRNEWVQFQGECHAEHSFELRIRPSSPVTTSNARWVADQAEGSFKLTYCACNKAQFQLEYSCTNLDTETLVTSSQVAYLCVGLQYALMLSQAHRMIGLHGVTMLFDDQVVILSAPSGTGKTTLANLLRKHTRAAVINGDFALLSVGEDGIVFEPTPFCGTSGICHNVRLKVDRIVFLEQAPVSEAQPLSAREAYTRLLSNCFVPTWDREKTVMIREHVLQIVEQLPIDRFAFPPTPDAAEYLYRYLHRT